MTRYAENTSVSADKSRAEIERTLARYGATQFMYGWQEGSAVIAFQMKDRNVRFVLKMPDRNSEEFTLTPSKKYYRDEASAEKAYEQATRQRWRALALAVKAKLEAVEAEIATFEQEFLAHIIMPDNRTVGEWVSPELDRAYRTGEMPKLLGAWSGEND